MARTTQAVGAAAAVIMLVVAGCLGGGEATSLGGVTSPDGGGAIRGTVLSDELAPVAAAVVAVEGVDNMTSTGPDGVFTVRGIEPGTYRVIVQAIGFIGQAKTVTVADGETSEVQFTLETAPVQEPYTELLIFDGYEVCSLVLGVLVYGPPTIPCTETPQTQFMVKAEDSWRYLVAEMDWETSDSMWFLVTENGGACNTGASTWCWNKIGSAPLRIEGGPDDEGRARQYALDGETTLPNGSFEFAVDSTYAGMFRDEVNGTAGDHCNLVIQTALGVLGQQWNPNLGCGLGYGYSTGIRIQFFVSIFHWEPPAAPGQYTGMPDK